MTRIDQLMTRTVYTCRRDTSILQAAEAMEEHDVGALPVYEDGQLLGIVTDRDIVVRAVAQGLLRTRVEFIMSTEVATCHEDEEVAEVLERMRARQLRLSNGFPATDATGPRQLVRDRRDPARDARGGRL